jgi:hypothetical protein
MLTPIQAYEKMRNPMKLSLRARLECHQVILREFQPLNKDQMMADAIADLAQGMVELLSRKK